MSRRALFGAVYALAVGILLAGLTFPAAGQGLRSVIESRDRVFPGIGAGVTAIKRDASGHYYILAKPESVISIYGSDGNLIGRIPNAKSNGATIRYAAAIDLTPEGQLVVADRGANAILVFSADGSFISRTPVADPTSVVALPDGQFAVTTLTSKRLVEVIDQRGRVMRSFGDPADAPGQPEDAPPPPKESLVDRGHISGDSSGAIYFAFTTVPNPTVRKYDKLGYLGYEATIPEHVFGEGPTQPNNRVEVTLGFSDVSFSQQSSAFLTIGSANDVKFGGGVGTGLGQQLRSGMGFGQAIQQQTNPSLFGAGPLGAMFSGEASGQGTNFQMGLGRMSGMGGRGRRGGFGSATDQTNSAGAALHFSSSGDDSSDSSSLDQSGYSFDPNSMNAELQSGPFGSNIAGTSDASGAGTFTGTPAGLGSGDLPGSFILGTEDRFDFRRPEIAGGTNSPLVGAGAALGGKPGPAGARPAGAGAHSASPLPHGGYHGRFGANSFAFTSNVRVNLGDLGRVSAFDKPIITAMAADPETHEIWAGIGDTLVHFSKDGDPIGIYYLVLGGSKPLKPVAVLVEPDRFLIASDPWGIFEFARPDKPQTPTQNTVVPQVVSQPQ